MVNTFIFDIGNVVWFYKPSLEELFHSWADICQIPYEDLKTQYKSFYKLMETNQKTLDDFVHYLNQSDPTPFRESLELIYDQLNFQNRLNLPVLHLITDLRSIFKVGFLSNGENFFYPYIQQKFLPYFDFGYTSWELGLEKPDPEIYLQTLKLQNLKPEEVVFIDDTQKNIDAAKALGIKSILFENNQQFISELKIITF